jgi:hypothetical protein
MKHSNETDGVEAVLRDTFRRNEHLADGAAERLLPAVRAGSESGHRRSPGWVPVMVAVVLAGGAVPAAFAVFGGGSGVLGGPAPVGQASVPTFGSLDEPPAAGWRWESSLGLVAAVPETWAINDFGCRMTGQASVVRGRGVVQDCLSLEPETKEVAVITELVAPVTADQVLVDAMLPDAPRQPVVIDGVAGELVQGQLADGRYAGAVLLPDAGAALYVRTLSAVTTAAILDSLRVVEFDHLGCPTVRPDESAPAPGTSFVDPAPAAISLCYYGEAWYRSGTPRLGASGQLTGDAAAGLAALINAAPRGGNPDVSANQCMDPVPAAPDAVLQVTRQDGAIERLWVSWSGCVHRGVSNGQDQVQVSHAIISTIMDPLVVGYGYASDLP